MRRPAATQLLVERYLNLQRTVAHQAVPTGRQHFVGVAAQQTTNDRRRKQDSTYAGTIANLVQDVSQTPRPFASLVLSQRIAGALEGPVGVEFAENVILVSAIETVRPAGDLQRIFLRDVRPPRRKRCAPRPRRTRPAGADARPRPPPSPIRGSGGLTPRLASRPAATRALPPQSAAQVQIAQFDRFHHVPSLGRGLPIFLISPDRNAAK